MEPSRTRRILSYLRNVLTQDNQAQTSDVSDVPRTETTRRFGINSAADRGLFSTITQGIRNLITRVPGIRRRVQEAEENPRPDKVVREDLSKALDDLQERARERLTRIAQALQSGRITPDQFRTQVVSEIRQIHLGAAILGVGGAGNLSSYHIQLVNQAVDRQSKFLDRFVEQIRSKLASNQPVGNRDIARTRQYASAAKTTAVQSRRQLMLNEFPAGQERRVLSPAEHCPDSVLPGQLVSTNKGLVPVELIKVGDLVHTRKGLKPVTEVIVKENVRVLYKVTLEDKRAVVLTDNHPLWTGKGWVEAKDLQSSDVLFQRVFPELKEAKIVGSAPLFLGSIAGASLPLLTRRFWEIIRMRMPVGALYFNNQREVGEEKVSQPAASLRPINILSIERYVPEKQVVQNFLLWTRNTLLLVSNAPFEKILSELWSVLKSFLFHNGRHLRSKFWVISSHFIGRLPGTRIKNVFVESDTQRAGTPYNGLRSTQRQVFDTALPSPRGIPALDNVVFFSSPIITLSGMTREAYSSLCFSGGGQGTITPGTEMFSSTRLALYRFLGFSSFQAYRTNIVHPAIRTSITESGSVSPRQSTFIAQLTQHFKNLRLWLNSEITNYTINLEVLHEPEFFINSVLVHNCVEYADAGWQAVGTLPPIGDSQCGDNCKCSFSYRSNESDADEHGENDADGVVSETAA